MTRKHCLPAARDELAQECLLCMKLLRNRQRSEAGHSFPAASPPSLPRPANSDGGLSRQPLQHRLCIFAPGPLVFLTGRAAHSPLAVRKIGKRILTVKITPNSTTQGQSLRTLWSSCLPSCLRCKRSGTGTSAHCGPFAWPAAHWKG